MGYFSRSWQLFFCVLAVIAVLGKSFADDQTSCSLLTELSALNDQVEQAKIQFDDLIASLTAQRASVLTHRDQVVTGVSCVKEKQQELIDFLIKERSALYATIEKHEKTISNLEKQLDDARGSKK